MEVASHIDHRRYEPLYVGISRAGTWALVPKPGPGWEEGDNRPGLISPDRDVHGLLVADGGGWRPVHLDAVFPVLHGTTGEDGAVQGLLELAGIPYVGCGIASSAICMDKSMAYVVVRSAGISTPEFTVVDGTEAVDAGSLVHPVFVKPARSGSSFGVSRVEQPDELPAAIAAARRYDAKVIVEAAVTGSEVGCAVMGAGSDLTVGEVDQIHLHHGFFRIHQESEPEKGSANSVVTVPADLPEATRDRVRATARAIYTALGCRGLARVDMFLQPDGRIVLNEVNTLPGFTTYSRFPRMMAAAGIPMSAVIDRCLSMAMAEAT
jgi:D-alanine--(R)-lactate ligase